MNTFESWFEQKFLQWQADRGKRGSIREFSEWLGADQKLVARWMSGNRKPGSENIRSLALKFGLEAYDALGLPRPDPELFRIEAVWDALPDQERIRLANLAEDLWVRRRRSKRRVLNAWPALGTSERVLLRKQVEQAYALRRRWWFIVGEG
jgi:hypothetical protein